MKKINYSKLIFSILICEIAGILGSIFTVNSINSWYQFLNKPVFNPPSWIFGPVWTLLYLMMGVSFYIIWNKESEKVKYTKEKIIFAIQLVLNIAWSILFFGFQSPVLALIEIVFLWIAIWINIFFFYKISKTSGLLLIPYVFWVSFATVLNYYLYILN